MNLRPTLLACAMIGAATATAAAAAGAASPRFAVPFVEDDYAAALQQARTQKVPIFLDAWAPW